MKNGFLKLCKSDWVKGLIMFVGSTVLAWLQAMWKERGFTLDIDWNQVLDIAVIATTTYIGKNLLTTNSGHFAGVVKVEEK